MSTLKERIGAIQTIDVNPEDFARITGQAAIPTMEVEYIAGLPVMEVREITAEEYNAEVNK